MHNSLVPSQWLHPRRLCKRHFEQHNIQYNMKVLLSKSTANVEEAKVTKTLAAVMVGFKCCWLPICITDNIVAARGGHTLRRQAYLTYGFLGYLSSTINTFIYDVTNRQFRREYKAILSKILRFHRQNDNNS